MIPVNEYKPLTLYEWDERHLKWREAAQFTDAGSLRHYIAERKNEAQWGNVGTKDQSMIGMKPYNLLRTYYCGHRIFRRIMTTTEAHDEPVERKVVPYGQKETHH